MPQRRERVVRSLATRGDGPVGRPLRFGGASSIIDQVALLAAMQSPQPYRLVYGGEPDSFRRAHIPGSVAFASPADAARVLRGGRRIIVYGPDERCLLTEYPTPHNPSDHARPERDEEP